jgi:predicted PurR-regulated permease PerM
VRLEGNVLVAVVVAVSLAFFWILWPYYAALLWAVVTAIVFTPLFRGMLRVVNGRRNTAAAITLLIVVVLVIVPLTLLATALLQESATLLARIQAGEFKLGDVFERLVDWLPGWGTALLERFGVGDLAGLRTRLTAGIASASQLIATQALTIGTVTFGFLIGLGVMLYLLFFLLRDGDALAARLRDSAPLPADQQRALINKFIIVIRATVKGSIVVAIVQGALGGLIFWLLGVHAPLLWAVMMAFAALIPAVGAALVWVPVALYLLLSGGMWQAMVLVAFGVLVIGLVDNLLRPLLVGKDTKMPDWLVLLATLGGIEVFGINGLVMGPVIAAMFIAAWDIFTDWRRGRPARDPALEP